ncbi:MAG TPA: haloacid dehalogenase-like hydrolase [Actinomycetales bacterium]|nr:haloacid dehalogenase-like hydrolase [Actinomycetales bacterium]
MDLAVGFDLDMTLVDSSPGILATLQRTLAERGLEVPREVLWPSMGLPLEMILGPHVPEADLPAAVARYRELYPTLGVPHTVLLPGAAESLAAVRALHGRVVVVSAKFEPAVHAVLDRVGLRADVVVGELFAADKGRALAEHGVSVYVGDHPGDVAGGLAAGAVPIGVTTGAHDAAALRDAGAEVLLESLSGLPAWLDEHVLEARLRDLDERLRGLGSVLVAFSGGADSAFLLAAAVRALGPGQVAAATAVSGSLATGELDDASAFARGMGVRHLTPATDELSRDGYRANAGDRCFFCKAELLDVLGPLAAELGVAAVATGTNADDAVAGFRPGMRAAAERGAVTPLRDAGLTKAQVREASRRWELPTWSKPAAACLSSRIAYGVQITPAGLGRVDRAEQAVRDVLAAAGVDVRDLRVRDLGDDRARVELDAATLERLGAAPEVGARVTGAAVAAGFSVAEVDPRGFRSGSMNELLAAPERYR